MDPESSFAFYMPPLQTVVYGLGLVALPSTISIYSCGYGHSLVISTPPAPPSTVSSSFLLFVAVSTIFIFFFFTFCLKHLTKDFVVEKVVTNIASFLPTETVLVFFLLLSVE